MAKAPRPALRFVDRLVLLVAWLVTCGLVYVLGFYVGNKTQEHRPGMEEREVRLPVTSVPPPEGQRPKEAREFPSFYQALPGGERPIEVARAPTSTTVTVVPTTVRPTTTVPAGAAPTATTLKPAVTTTPTTRPSTTTLPRPPAATPSPPPGATTGPPPAVTSAPPAAPPAATPPPAATRPVAHTPSWTVEASPTRSRVEAEQLQATLRKRGYDATLVQVQRDGDAWYRLRIGRYATAEQANEVMRKLRDGEGVAHAFVASE
ncbi:MAG TPA: SPOR domain-containing protein [Candidatus Eisenbacteria bacterium]|nr:SPOR domain-containing protein [Candidatus Eisenbacteria bacterium]